MDPFGPSVDLKDNINSISGDNENSNSILPKKKSTLIIIFIFLVVLTLVILILVFKVLDNKDSSKSEENTDPIPPVKNLTISGEINCIYSIRDTNSETPLLSKEFENKDTIIDIYIDDNKTNYNTEYKFSSTGRHSIKYVLNSEIIMDYMFKDIQNIIFVESMNVYPNSTVKILSMKSTFEGCSSLRIVSLNDSFDTMELKSILLILQIIFF